MQPIRKRLAYALALIMAIALLAWVPSQAAQASSDYDNLIQVEPELFVYTDGSTQTQTMDISSSWWEDYKQSYARRLDQGLPWPTNFVSEFEDIVANGGSWGVMHVNDRYGDSVLIVGTHDPNATCEFVGTPPSSSFQCTSGPGYGFVRSDGLYYSEPWCYFQGGYRCSDNGLLVNQAPILAPTGGSSTYTFLSLTETELDWHRFFFMNFDVQYPTGYEGQEIPAAYTAEYVAMGDSFSSGEGNPPFESGTDIDLANECHRSEDAYPMLLHNELSLGSMAFVACSGATTYDVLGVSEDDERKGSWNQPTQLSALSEHTEIVTITVGGNDVGFKAFAEKCIHPINLIFLDEVCDEFTDAYADIIYAIESDLPGRLENVYMALLSEAPNANIYIGGYPIIAPNKSVTDPFDNKCGGLYDESPFNTWGDARAAYEVVNLLNQTIEDTISSVKINTSTTRLHYVDVSSGPFTGHDICEDDSYFNGMSAINTEYVLHPNTDGQIAYMEEFEEAINP
jgi:hypothetical protein